MIPSKLSLTFPAVSPAALQWACQYMTPRPDDCRSPSPGACRLKGCGAQTSFFKLCACFTLKDNQQRTRIYVLKLLKEFNDISCETALQHDHCHSKHILPITHWLKCILWHKLTHILTNVLFIQQVKGHISDHTSACNLGTKGRFSVVGCVSVVFYVSSLQHVFEQGRCCDWPVAHFVLVESAHSVPISG